MINESTVADASGKGGGSFGLFGCFNKDTPADVNAAGGAFADAQMMQQDSIIGGNIYLEQMVTLISGVDNQGNSVAVKASDLIYKKLMWFILPRVP